MVARIAWYSTKDPRWVLGKKSVNLTGNRRSCRVRSWGFMAASREEWTENDAPLCLSLHLFIFFPFFIIFCSLSRPSRSRLGRWTSWNDLAIAFWCFLLLRLFLFSSPCNIRHSWEARRQKSYLVVIRFLPQLWILRNSASLRIVFLESREFRCKLKTRQKIYDS